MEFILFTYLFSGEEFKVLERFIGHEDWVTSLDTVIINNSLLVASGGQDSIIRSVPVRLKSCTTVKYIIYGLIYTGYGEFSPIRLVMMISSWRSES
jgi:hypothetical protein